MSDDPFEAYGGRSGATHTRAKKSHVIQSEKEAPMKPSAMEEAQREKSVLLSQFKKAKRAEHQAMLDGAHGKPYAVMMAIVKKLPASSQELVANLRSGWTAPLDRNERQTVLGMISARIMLEREKQGLSPLDDPLPGDPDNLFIICRKIIMGY
ncbi:hypothetical protein [Bradyrhizobium sp. S3.7.6]